MMDIIEVDTGARIIGEDTLELLTDMLLVGLQATGEIERLSNALGLCQLAGERVPDRMRPIDPTGDAEVFSKFADALRLIRNLPKSDKSAY